MKQKIATILVTMMGLALLGFTALRTVDLIQLTLPTDQQIVGWLALVAFDGGLIGWALFYLYGARGAWQRSISALMIIVSLVGVLGAFVADTLYQSAARGTIAAVDPAMVSAAVWLMSVVIGLNVAAVTLTHLTDPDARRQQAEEEAQDKITEAALRQISANAEGLAAELAPQLGARWLSEMRAQYTARLETAPDAPGRAVVPLASPAPLIVPEPAASPTSASQPADFGHIQVIPASITADNAQDTPADLAETGPWPAVPVAAMPRPYTGQLPAARRNGNGNGHKPTPADEAPPKS